MNFYTSLIYKSFVTFLLISFFSVRSQTADSSIYYRIRSVSIQGNKKTKDRIIIRELIKKQNDTLLLRNLLRIIQRSEYNIFNTQLFIYDSVKYEIDHEKKVIDYNIKVKERWYIWPIPFIDYLDRNFNAWWQNKDPERLSYGVALGIDNFTGVKDRLIVLFKTGYADQFGFNYRMPYLNSKQTLGAQVQAVYNEYNKLSYRTLDNKQQFIVSEKQNLRNEISAKVGLFYRPHIFLQHSLDINYSKLNVSDTVIKSNPNYLSFENKNLHYMNFVYRLNYDTRDNKIYPLKGFVFDLSIIKDGFNISDRSPINSAQTLLSLKKHTQLNRSFFLANMIRGRFVNTDQRLPYIFNSALGYGSFVRGYEYNVIDGQNYLFTRNSIRYQLIKPKFHEVKQLQKMKSFSTIPFYCYISAYADACYVKEEYYMNGNPLINKWQYGYGIGIDFITYYDFVLRLEYSINKQNQKGLFVHFTSGF